MEHDQTTIAAVIRAKDSVSEQMAQRAAIHKELEAEARGLALAARMNGFMVNLMNGTATVIDTRSAACATTR